MSPTNLVPAVDKLLHVFVFRRIYCSRPRPTLLPAEEFLGGDTGVCIFVEVFAVFFVSSTLAQIDPIDGVKLIPSRESCCSPSIGSS